MTEDAYRDLAVLDAPKSIHDEFRPPAEREGLTVAAGQLRVPWDTHSLFILTLLNKGALANEATAAGNEESVEFFKAMGQEVEAALAGSAESKAVEEAAASHDAALPELEELERAAAEAESAVTAAGAKDKQRARRTAEDAQATLTDFRSHVATLERRHAAAEAALARKRQALRAAKVAEKTAELKARRDALREFSTGALVTIGGTLLALTALEQALAAKK